MDFMIGKAEDRKLIEGELIKLERLKKDNFSISEESKHGEWIIRRD
jgi:hypothetical protein